MDKSTPSSENRSTTILKHILIDIALAGAIAFGFVKFHTPINSSPFYDFSAQSNRILQDQEIELNWERQHVFDLQRTLGKVSESQQALVQLNVRMERKLKELELKLAAEENALLKAKLQALGRKNSAADFIETNGRAVDESTSNLRGGGTFRVGDVVQIRGTASAAPWKIQSRNQDGTYCVIQTTDGEVTSSVRQDNLSLYEPYDIGSEALCNMGTYGSGHVDFVPCSILQYSPLLTKRPTVLQGKYKVRIYEREGDVERFSMLPMWEVTKRP